MVRANSSINSATKRILDHAYDRLDKEVDGGLPLEQLLKPDPELRNMLVRMKGAKKWAFTNAGQTVSVYMDAFIIAKVDLPLSIHCVDSTLCEC